MSAVNSILNQSIIVQDSFNNRSQAVFDSIKITIESNRLFEQVAALPTLALTDKTYTALATLGNKAHNSFLARLLRVVQKVIQAVAYFFVYFGGFFTIFSLLGIFIDKHPATKMMSVLVGMAFGCSVSLLGFGFQLLVRGLVLAERKWINHYFQNLSSHKELQHAQIEINRLGQDLKDLKQWTQINEKDLSQVRKIVKSGLKQLKLQKDFSSQPYDAALANRLVEVSSNIHLFDSAVHELKDRRGGREVLSFLQLRG